MRTSQAETVSLPPLRLTAQHTVVHELTVHVMALVAARMCAEMARRQLADGMSQLAALCLALLWLDVHPATRPHADQQASLLRIAPKAASYGTAPK